MKRLSHLLVALSLLALGVTYAQIDIPTPYNGDWKMGGSVVTITQQGTKVTGTFKQVASNAKLYKAGDTAFSGNLKGTKFTGQFELRQRSDDGETATKKTPIELSLLPGGMKLKGRFEDRQFDKVDGEWTDKTRWVNLMLTRDEQAEPRFVTKKENLGIDLKHDTGTFVEAKSVREGVPFWVELQFEEPPHGMTRSVKVTSQGSEHDVTVTRASEDGKLYRSGKPLMFEAMMELAPEQPNNAPVKSKKIITAERSPIDWFYDTWRLSYFDQNLGTVRGNAQVKPNTKGGVDVTVMLRHPEREGYNYYLTSSKSELKGNQLTVTLEDHSPSSARMATGHDHAANVHDAVGLFVSIGSTEGATATFGDNEAKVSFSDEQPSESKGELELTFDLKEQAEKLVVEWAIPMDPKTGFIGRRHGRLKLEELKMTGLENWTRMGIQIDKVTSLEDIDNSKWRRSAGMLIDGQTVKSLWLRLEGKGLTFETGEDLQVIFDDKAIEYAGVHRKDEDVEGAWNIKVDLNRSITPGEKTFTLNEAPGTWTFDPKGLDPTVTFVRQVMADTFRDAQELYGGEMFYLQARYRTKPYFDERDIELLVNKKPVQKLKLTRSADDPHVYHSQALLLPGNPAAYEAIYGEAKGAAVEVPPDAIEISAKEGDALFGRFEAIPDHQTKQSELAFARVLGLPSNEWIKALEKAEDCYKNSNSSLKTQNPKGYAFTNTIITQFSNRTVRMNMRDHAALLLVRDFATKALRQKVQEMNAPDPVSLIEDRKKHDAALRRQNAGKGKFAEASIHAAGKGMSHPLFVMEVSSPNGNEKLKLRDALQPGYLKSNVGIKQQDQVDYARRVISEAEGVMLGYASLSLNRLQTTGDCDVDRLLRTCGMGFGRCAELVKDKLLIPANDGSGRLVPDRAGYVSIDKIAGLYQAVKSQEEYARADTDLVVFLATSPFLFVSVSANFGYLAASSYASTLATVSAGGLLAADLVEVPLLFSDASQYVKLRDEEVGFRKGTVAIEGTEALKQTEAEANELYWRTMLSGGAMVGGTAIGEVGGVVAKRLAKGNIEALEDAVIAASKNGVNSLSGSELNALADAGLLKVLKESPGAETADRVLAALAEQKELLRTGGKETADTAADVATATDNMPTPSGGRSNVGSTAEAGADATDDLAGTAKRPTSATDEFADAGSTPKGATDEVADSVNTSPGVRGDADTGGVKPADGEAVADAGEATGGRPNRSAGTDSSNSTVADNTSTGTDSAVPSGGRRGASTSPEAPSSTNTGRRPSRPEPNTSPPSNGGRTANTGTDVTPQPGGRRGPTDAPPANNPPRRAEGPTASPPRNTPPRTDPDGGTVIFPRDTANAGAPPARPRSNPDGLTKPVPPPTPNRGAPAASTPVANAPRPPAANAPSPAVANTPAPPRVSSPDAPTPTRTIDFNGEQVQLGKKLGEGQYSDVYELTGSRKGQVIKIAKVTDDISPKRAAEKVLEAKQISELLEENGIPQVKVVDIHADVNGQSYTITEIIPDDAKLIDHLSLESNRADLIASGKWTAEHERAVFELYDKMASKDLLWMDGHLDNVYFLPGKNGKLTAGILDHDMIAPLKNLPESLDNRLGDAITRAGEQNINSLQGMSLGKRATYSPKTGHEAMAMMLEHKALIGFENGKFVPRRLDPTGLKNFEGFNPYIKPDDVVSDGLLTKSASNLNETARLDMPDFDDLTGTAKLDMPEFDELKSTARGGADELTETAKLDMPEFDELKPVADGTADELTKTAKLDMPKFDELKPVADGTADELTETAKLDMPKFDELKPVADGTADELTRTAKLDMPEFDELKPVADGTADELTKTAKLDMPEFDELKPVANGTADELTKTAKLDMPEFDELTSSTRAKLPEAAPSNAPVDPMNPPKKITVQGEELEIGEYIGKGEYSVVYKLKGAREGQVLKIAKTSNDITPKRAAEKVLEAKQISDLLEERNIPQVKVLDVSADPNGQSYTISELLPPKAFEVNHEVMFHNRAKQIAEGKWSADHEYAVLELYEKIASENLLWMDGHLNNIYFYPGKDGKLAAGILDHDMIAPLDDLTDALDQRLGDAIVSAGKQNIHSLQRLSLSERARYFPSNGYEAMALMLEHKGLIGFENGKFVPRGLDPKSLEVFEKFRPYINPDDVVTDGLLKAQPGPSSSLPLRFEQSVLLPAA